MTQSNLLFERAQRTIPGGVNSPVRAFGAVGGNPPFIVRAAGPYLYDADGNRLIDYVGSWGPMIAGHAHPQIVAAVREAAGRGLSYGAPTAAEADMAERLCELMPSVELVRMVNSGTEATMSAIRLARAVTGRDKILKFEGCYHGHSDALLVKAGSGALTLGVPSSPGVPKAVARDTLTLAYNDVDAVRRLFAASGDEIAGVIVEPIAGNMNCVPAAREFLAALRHECKAHGAALIFDEVMTGFRVGLHGAQGLYGIEPDLTTLGKVIGGGMPAAAFGGRRALMEHIAPLGPVYQAGTLSGNPLAMAAGLKTLELVSRPGFYEELAAKTATLVEGILEQATAQGVPMCANHVGGMFGLFFTTAPEVRDFTQVMACDPQRFRRFFHSLLAAGVYWAPSPYEAGFVSSAHSEADIAATVAAAARGLRAIAEA